MHAELGKMQIVAVDDTSVNLTLLATILASAEYDNVLCISDPYKVEEELGRNPPDLLFLDLHMPGRDGFEILAGLAPQVRGPDMLPVCVITADSDIKVRRQALQMGARDFIVKPIDAIEVLMRTRNLLEARWLQQHLRYELERSGFENLERLAHIAESRDSHDYEHATRVGRLARRIAEAMGLGSQFAAMIRETAALHDVGKIVIPDSILRKPGPLTPEEFDVMRTHTTVGSEMFGTVTHSLGLQGRRVVEARLGSDLPPDHAVEIGLILLPWPLPRLWQVRHTLPVCSPCCAEALASSVSIGPSAGGLRCARLAGLLLLHGDLVTRLGRRRRREDRPGRHMHGQQNETRPQQGAEEPC